MKVLTIIKEDKLMLGFLWGQKRQLMAVFLSMVMLFAILPADTLAYADVNEELTTQGNTQNDVFENDGTKEQKVTDIQTDDQELIDGIIPRNEAVQNETEVKEELDGARDVVNDSGAKEEIEENIEETKELNTSPALTTTTISLTSEMLTEGTYNTDFSVGDFMINASAEKTVVIEANKKTANDGTNFTKRIKLGGTGESVTRSIHFTVKSAAVVKVYAMSSNSEDRSLNLYNSAGSVIGSSAAFGASIIVGTINISEPGSYYFASPASGVNVYGITVTKTGEEQEPERGDWNMVAPPVITRIEQSMSKIIVTFDLLTGTDGADKATVYMKDENDTEVDNILIGTDSAHTIRTVEFLPSKSGSYHFVIIAERTDNSTIKESKVSENLEFLLPLKTPIIKGINNIGGGSVFLAWEAVPEAVNYIISFQQEGTTVMKESNKFIGTKGSIHDLKIDENYRFWVSAIRGDDKIISEPITLTISQEEERAWFFSAFGPGVNEDNNHYIKDDNEEYITVVSENGKGKLQPTSTDGLAYYYTTIDPEKENFILSGNVTVDSWTFSNGQEGFGLMASDAVGAHTDSSVFWNNSYMLGAMKVEYYWDPISNQVSDAGDKIIMKQGIGAQEKIGITAENIADGSMVSAFRSKMVTMETSCSTKSAGTYNIIGNFTNQAPPTGTVDLADLKASFQFKLQRDNTGYRLSYTDEAGNTVSKLFYDINRDALTQIDKDNIYVGFFASRNARITVTNINLTVSDPATDPPAEEQGISYITPIYEMISAKTSAVNNHELIFIANADGSLMIKDRNGKVIVNQENIVAGTYNKYSVVLTKGDNNFQVSFTPDQEYKPSEFEKLSSYEPVTFDHNVNYKSYDLKVLHISPEGTSNGTGKKNSPIDIYTAVQYAKPGQILLLAGGIYNLNSKVTIERGMDGSGDKMIYLIADENENNRPILDFNKVGEGLVLAGDYWYLKGFDITKSADASKGLQISGSHNVVDGVNTYYNGNTGIQISRYLTSDTYEDWPAYNLILNCTSYGNADRGYEDADGFAAKLTVGDGNVFDGCIAYNNADDGWDLFAKIETGPIGQVEIKNCVAYGNGYLPDGTNAGNGNGFKLGGSSISGYHKLINSVAYDNKAKGIDSNSCPDIQIYQCTTFNNGSYNVAFYTTDTPNTDFFAEGLISYRTLHKNINENIKPLGSQDNTKIYGATNYYWVSAKEQSENILNEIVTADWFINLNTNTEITRNEDGTIQMNGLLVFKENVLKNLGARVGGSPSKNIEIPEEESPVTVTPPPQDSSNDDTFREKLINEILSENRLNEITVNNIKSTETDDVLLYTGGTTNKTKELLIKLPDSIQDAINKNILFYQITYSSDNKEVATVSDIGLITGISAGEVVITTKISLENKTITFKTNVKVEKARIVFVKDNQKLVVNKSVTYEIKLYGYSAKDIEWMTSKRNISVVSKNNGKTKAVVYGVSKGTEVLYIRLKGHKTSLVKIKISVSDPKEQNKSKEVSKAYDKDKNTDKTTDKEEKYISYTVKAGDSLWKIAQRYQITLSNLLAINEIQDPNKISVGEIIKIPN